MGCGNPLRGDDGVGPVLVRRLRERGVPDGVRLVDGGTAGADVASRMRGAGRVVIVDAGAVGVTPGTVYRVPGSMLANLPPLHVLHTRSFRWDHAVAFARWALADACPDDITVFLVEAGNVAMGAPLSPSVATAVDEVVTIVERDYPAPARVASEPGS
ncbi:hydrogenase maturation protease [Umezawaea endophytica]|uniref:Hydrogenase maturation protease n=1 Tax=Umezawaea endophytica TaxID=1654476 RepID=A0A9X2VN72_9PSEU|nr:hydrogenase maturation protease [Umezawaea endophytica]MCS7479539.1 hydrogenase maturation protease [Umezawaea endophytica]